MRRVVALSVAGLALLGACSGSGADTRVLGKTFERPSVSGVVRRDGAAVAGARVLLGDTGRTAVTDASGSYRFETVEPGPYRLVVLGAGDDTPVCSAGGACITARAARHAAVEVRVGERPAEADIDL